VVVTYLAPMTREITGGANCSAQGSGGTPGKMVSSAQSGKYDFSHHAGSAPPLEDR
jgi:hypothetical protein